MDAKESRAMAIPDCCRRRTRLVLLAAILTCGVSRPAYADSAPRWTDAQLAGFSDVIVRGRVTRVAVGRDRSGALYTYVTLSVADVVKGAVPDRTIIIKQLGGRSGSTALAIGGQPTFAANEDVVVFLEARPRDGTLSTTAQWQGKFTIASNDSNAEVATRQDPGALARGVFGGESRVVITWLQALRGESAGAAASPAGDIVFAPPEAAAASPDAGGSSMASASWRDVSLPHQAVRVDALAPGQAQLAGGGELDIRGAADFWTATGMTTLSTGGLQPAGCFTTRDPDGRIAIGADACGELNPRGGTVAVSGAWLRIGTDDDGAATSAFLGGGVIVNGGDAASRLLARSSCFERLVTHELGHTLGATDSPDGAGVMAPALDNCDLNSTTSAPDTRPMFVPLTAGASLYGGAASASAPDVSACVGCRFAPASVTSPGATNLAYTLNGSTLTLTWTAPVTSGNIQSYLIRAGSMPDQADVANFFIYGSSPGPAFGVPPPTTFSAAVGGNAVFYVRVTAFLEFAGQTAPSNEIAIVLGNATPPPLPPSGLTAAATGNNVTLGWTAPGGQTLTSYIVQAGSQPGSSELANFSTGNSATVFSAAGVAFGTYYVRVRTVNGASISIPSNEVQLNAINTCTAPGPPGGLAATVTGSTVTLTWTAGSGASSYQLQAGSSPGRVDLADQNLLSPATSYVASNVGSGTYFVRVRSNNACGQSAPSNEVTIIIR
jgi:hypothetical protein